MMRIGKLPSLPPLRRPISRRRTLPYSGRRKSRAISPRPKAAAPAVSVNDDVMLFDQPPAELPVATIIPKDRSTQLAADLRAWFAARWYWFRPRTIPMVVAFVGMLAVIGAATWLRNYARRAPDRIVEQQPHDASISLGD
jgi:hypothetical protein